MHRPTILDNVTIDFSNGDDNGGSYFQVKSLMLCVSVLKSESYRATLQGLYGDTLEILELVLYSSEVFRGIRVNYLLKVPYKLN